MKAETVTPVTLWESDQLIITSKYTELLTAEDRTKIPEQNFLFTLLQSLIYPKNVILALLELKGFSTERAAELLNAAKKINDDLQEEAKRKNLRPNKAERENQHIRTIIKEIEATDKLGKEAESAIKLFDFNTERDAAEKVIACIPGIQTVIKNIEKNENAADIFIRAGEDFLKTETPPPPKWSRHYLNLLLHSEIKERAEIALFRAKIKERKANNTIYPVGYEMDLVYHGEIQAAHYAKIKETITTAPEIIQSFYNTNYYTILKHINDIPPSYNIPEGVFTMQEIALQYYFATTATDPCAQFTEISFQYIEDILDRISFFFATQSKKGESQYTTLIKFIKNETATLKQKDIQLLMPPGMTYTPLNKKYRNITITGLGGTLLDQRLAARILGVLQAYAFKWIRYNPESDGVIRAPINQLIYDIFGKPVPDTNKKYPTIEQWNLQKLEFIRALVTLTAPIDANSKVEEFLFGGISYDPETGIFAFRSPWMEKRYHLIQEEAITGKKRKELKQNSNKQNENKINPYIVIKLPEYHKENIFVTELADAIFTGLIKAQSLKMYRFNPYVLIKENCPQFYAAIEAKKTSSEKTKLLRVTFTRFYKVLHTKTLFYKYLNPMTKDENGTPLKIPQPPYFSMENPNNQKSEVIGKPTPTYKQWRNQIITIHHGGKNKKFKAPT